MYVGDYLTPEEGSEMAALFGRYPYDAILDEFSDVTALFRCAKECRAPPGAPRRPTAT